MNRTLVCIHRFYKGEDGPMSGCLEKDADYFELFVDFKGFVYFFFFHNLVGNDYKSIKMVMESNDLSTHTLSQTADEYRL